MECLVYATPAEAMSFAQSAMLVTFLSILAFGNVAIIYYTWVKPFFDRTVNDSRDL